MRRIAYRYMEIKIIAVGRRTALRGHHSFTLHARARGARRHAEFGLQTDPHEPAGRCCCGRPTSAILFSDSNSGANDGAIGRARGGCWPPQSNKPKVKLQLHFLGVQSEVRALRANALWRRERPP